MMALISGAAYVVGDHAPYAVGYAFAMAWYYSRALQEHSDQDPKMSGWRNNVIFFWDEWRQSKFWFAFVPATIALAALI